jgi:single-stranded DNA-binding protein
MNNCMLMAEIVQPPQLRYTSDNQTPVAEFVVQFPGLREGDPPSQMKIVGWGNLAQDIQQNYRAGQRVLLEGRLSMNVVDRPEGFKEKQAEMTVQRIYDVGTLNTMPMTAAAPVNTISATGPVAAGGPPTPTTPTPATPTGQTSNTTAETNPSYDDIPF